MSGPTLLNTSLVSAIQHLRDVCARLPQATPEGPQDGIVWQCFSTKPQDMHGSVLERVNQAFTQCFPPKTSSGVDPVQNVFCGAFGMEIVIRFFEECLRLPSMSSTYLYLI
ncbi:hypothetical protein ACGC1H_000333 [Rhizoctonia solani]